MRYAVLSFTAIALLCLATMATESPAPSDNDAGVANEPACDPKIVACLTPSAFPDLPHEIAEYLASNHYLIPQPYPYGETLYNVVGGDILGTGAKDWVVDALKNGRTYRLFFPAGKVSDVDVSGGNCLQVGADGMEFAIGLATPKYILDHAKAYDSPPPFEITHDGINEMILEKASIVRYFHEGQWYELQGSD